MMTTVKRVVREALERVLRRLPVARAAFGRADELGHVVDELRRDNERLTAMVVASSSSRVPPILSPAERSAMTARCRDADVLPKVPRAGEVVVRSDASRVQIMFNGIQVVAGGYYGTWMEELIQACHGHHEPQEEVVFAEVMRHVGDSATMIELGGFWSFYSIWFAREGAGRRAVVVEPDPKHLDVGRRNAALNECDLTFVNAVSAGRDHPASAFATEESGVIDVPRRCVSTLMDDHSMDVLDVLHCDAQGVELDVLESCRELADKGRLRWFIISTHAESISGDPLTHQRCLAVLREIGATILVEHDVHESFSGDGLIVAKLGPVPSDWSPPSISYNRYSEALFRNPLYDLAECRSQRAAGALDRATSAHLRPRGGLFELRVDGALGRRGDALLMPFDDTMYPAVARDGGWSLETLQFLEARVVASRPYVVVDIGANVGLFSRQTALRFPNVTRLVCVEPESSNFEALQYNLRGVLGERAELWNVALSDHEGLMEFYRDLENIGNYSLNDDAMRDRPFDTVQVQCVDTRRWMVDHLPPDPDVALIWKSDTQGYDELIVSLTPTSVIERVEIAIMELWRIRKPTFDVAAFRARIDSFPNKRLGADLMCTTAEVLEFLSGDDWHHEDLYLWK